MTLSTEEMLGERGLLATFEPFLTFPATSLLPMTLSRRMRRDGDVPQGAPPQLFDPMNRNPASACRSAFSLLFGLLSILTFSTERVSAQGPVISMSVSPDGIGIGSCGELLIEIENNTPAVLNQVGFRLDFPEEAAIADPALASSDCGGDLEVEDGGRALVLTNGSIAANTTCSIRVGVTLLAEGPVVLTTSNLTSSAGSSPPATVSLDIPANGPSLGFSKSFGDTAIQLGGTTTLTYLIENQSGLPAEGISFVGDLSPGIVIAPSPNVESSCDTALVAVVPGSQQISVSGGSLQPGEACVISVDVVGVVSGDNASVSGPIRSSFPNEVPVASGFACAVLQVIAPADLANISLSKSFPDGPIAPGAEGTLRFTLTNNSATETFTDIAFTDDLGAMLPGTRAVDLPEQGGFAVDANFDGAANSVVGPRWDFLDSLENENGRSDDYPVDGSGNRWTSEDFDVATSNVGPWEQGDAPFRGGDIAAFPPGTPEQLGGIDAAPNGENLVTTYLFRQKFTLTAEQAGIAEWAMLSLFDDGAIVYINDKEVFRSTQIPDDDITPNTLAGLGDESQFATDLLDLTKRLQPGENTIAVEVHQNTLTSSDVGFALSLVPANQGGTQGFVYQDDTFEGTDDPGFSDGSLEPNEGFVGGALSVVTGGKGFFSFLNPPSSGGWTRTFTIEEDGIYPVSFRYRLLVSGEYEGDEFGQALFELDGVRYGNGPNNSLIQFTGGVGNDQDSGWRFFSNQVFLAKGEHTIVIGAYNNKSTQAAELTTAWFDEVQIGTPRTPEPVCGPDSSILGDEVLTFSGGRLLPGESCSFEVGIRVPLEVETGSYLNRTSVVELTSGPENLLGLPATETLLVETVPPFFQATFSPVDLTVSGNGTLTFTIDNDVSLLEANELAFTATLPQGVVIDSVIPQKTSCGGTLVAAAGGREISYSGGSLLPGETCVVSVGVSGVEPGDFVLSGVTLTSSLGESQIDDAPVTVSPLPLFDLAFAPAEINAGTNARVTFTIDNSQSRLEAGNLQLVLPFPNGVVIANQANPVTDCVGGVFSAIPGNNSFSYQGGAVPAGSVCTVSFNVTSSEGGDYLLRTDDLISSLGNSGTAEGTLTVNPLVSVGLSMTESTAAVVAGSGSGNLTYVVTALNGGPSRATSIEVSVGQVLPGGVTLDQVTPAAGAFAADQWSIPELGPGESTTLTLVLTAGAGTLPGNDVISNGASLVSVDQQDVSSLDDDAIQRTSVANVFDLQLSVAESIDPVIAASGPGNLQYTLTATNAGPSNATGVEIAALLDLPAGVTVDQVDPSSGGFVPGAEPGGAWNLSLPVGVTETLTVILSVDATAPDKGSIQITGSVSEANGVDPVAANNTASEETAIVAAVDLIVSATGVEQPVVAGSGPGNLALTFSVSNAGPLEATGVALTSLFDLADGVVLDSLAPSVGAVEGDIWNIDTLGVDETATLTATLTVGPSAQVAEVGATGSFTVTSVDQSQINVGDESALVTAGVAREVDLGFALTGSRDPVLAGYQLPRNLFHTLTLSNNGPSDASGVSVNLEQVFPEGVVIDATSPAAGTAFADGVWSVGDLAAGQSVSLITYFGIPKTVEGGEDLITTMAMVSGANEVLVLSEDDQISIQTDVASPTDTAIAAGEIELDFQTGLFKQTVTVTNNNPVAVPAFRLLVSGLAEGSGLHNAQGTVDGVPYVIVNQPLEPGESVELTMEFLQLDASGGLEPVFEIEFLDAVIEASAGDGVDVERCVVLASGDVMIEFTAVIGGIYTIQYSDNGESWVDVTPQVVSGGTKQQWVDNGPPKTTSPPGTVQKRFYRVLQMSAGN